MNQTIVIGHVALIQKSKRQGFTLDLIKELLKKSYDTVGVFAGECREPEYLTELKRKIEEYGLEGNVVLFGRRNDIPDLLKMVDLLIIPSAFEGFPLAGLEAAAAGVPVITCDAAGAKEFIEESSAGLTFIENDLNSAVEAVISICDRAEYYGKNGVRFAKDMSLNSYKKKISETFYSIE